MPTQSSAKRTRWPSTSPSAAAIGRSDISGTRLPLGRSKWLQTMTLAPLPTSSRMVGDSRSMRVQVGDLAVPHRHVQVGAQQDALAGGVRSSSVRKRGIVAHSASACGRGRRAGASHPARLV